MYSTRPDTPCVRDIDSSSMPVEQVICFANAQASRYLSDGVFGQLSMLCNAVQHAFVEACTKDPSDCVTVIINGIIGMFCE